MFYKIKDKYYSVKNGISSIIRWLPVIYKLRDWDASYLYLLIYKHLSHVEDYLRYNGCGVNSIKDADRIKIAKNLAKRLYEQEYDFNALMPIKEKYGELKYHFEPTNNEKLKATVYDEFPEERKARSKAYEHAEYMEKQDRKMLLTMLDKYIDEWED